MHSSWLVETASLWAYHGSTIIECNESLPPESVSQYWLRNRTRFDVWNGMLTALQPQLTSASAARRIRAWHKQRVLVEEILLAEPLSRVCVAIASNLESRGIDSDARSILHNVFQSHAEVRNRVLRIIVKGIDQGIEEADELNRIRHYLEHWTDMLLGYFANQQTASEYAFSVSRVEDFADDYGQRMLGPQSEIVWSLLMASSRAWLDRHCNHDPTYPTLNYRVCQAAMGMIHPEWFDSLGYWRSKTIQSIEHGINQAQATVESLSDDSWLLQSKLLRKHRSTSRIV